MSRSSLLVLHSCTTRIDELCKSMQNWWWPACSPTCEVSLWFWRCHVKLIPKFTQRPLNQEFGSVLTFDSFRSTKVLIVQVVFSPIYCNVSTWSTTNLTAAATKFWEWIQFPFIHNVASFAGLHPALTVCCANPCKTDQVNGLWTTTWKTEMQTPHLILMYLY